MLKKIAIVAERAAGAGLTENAGFPMMKTREKATHNRVTEARRNTEQNLELVFLCASVTLW